MRNNLSETLIALIDILPCHSREDGIYNSKSKGELTKTLCEHDGISRKEADILVNLVEAILDSESTLDQEKLDLGEWQFKSYAAQLMGLSKLATLADSKARYVDKEFWSAISLSQGADEGLANTRLEESEKVRWNSVKEEGGIAKPIRRSHVVWGFIKINGKFVFHRKEENVTRPLGELVPVGGKMNAKDFNGFESPEMKPIDRAILLKTNSLTDSKYEACWQNAMIREIREEVAERLKGPDGLEYGEDYKLQLMEPGIESYIGIRGVGVSYAAVRYHFKLFFVELTTRGYIKLRKNLINDRLYLATIDDIKKSKLGNKKLDIEALHDHFDEGSKSLEHTLESLPDSHKSPYYINKVGKTDTFIFPVLPNRDIYVMLNDSRHRKVFKLKNSLTNEEVELLLGLAAHARGFEFENISDGLTLLSDGWIDAKEKNELCAGLKSLVRRFPNMVEHLDDYMFRLSIDPEIIFFDEHLFEFEVDMNKLHGDDESKYIDILFYRAPFKTLIGTVKGDHIKRKTTKKRIAFFETCYNEEGLPFDFGNGDKDEQSEKDYGSIKKWIDDQTKEIGLKYAIHQSASMYKVTIKMKE